MNIGGGVVTDLFDEDTRTAVGESEGEGAKLDEGKMKSGNGKTLVKKDGVCQPSPETPSMRDLNDAVVVEEDVSGLVCSLLPFGSCGVD